MCPLFPVPLPALVIVSVGLLAWWTGRGELAVVKPFRSRPYGRPRKARYTNGCSFGAHVAWCRLRSARSSILAIGWIERCSGRPPRPKSPGYVPLVNRAFGTIFFSGVISSQGAPGNQKSRPPTADTRRPSRWVQSNTEQTAMPGLVFSTKIIADHSLATVR